MKCQNLKSLPYCLLGHERFIRMDICERKLNLRDGENRLHYVFDFLVCVLMRIFAMLVAL